MKRNVMKEWSNALTHTPARQRNAWTQVLADQRRSLVAQASRPFTHDASSLRRSTRSLSASDLPVGKQEDLARAILILQRNNKLLNARFGLEWPGAASVIAGEAVRRNMSAASLARVLTAGLRRDARRGGGA